MAVNASFMMEVIKIHQIQNTSLESFDSEIELLDVQESNEVLGVILIGAGIAIIIGVITWLINKLASSKSNNDTLEKIHERRDKEIEEIKKKAEEEKKKIPEKVRRDMEEIDKKVSQKLGSFEEFNKNNR